jgi:hypothetical protein
MYLNFDKNDYESLHRAFYFNKLNVYNDDEEELNFDEFCLPFSGKNFSFILIIIINIYSSRDPIGVCSRFIRREIYN